MEICSIAEQDYSQVAAIYKEGIDTGNATFETEVPDWKQWNAKHLASCRIAAFDGKRMLGWAALSPISAREVYAGVAEVSVYVATATRRTGLGKLLLQALISESEHDGIWTLQAGIFPENVASIGLHESCGFRQVGYREKIGRMNGVWRDTVLLERRSKVAGV